MEEFSFSVNGKTIVYHHGAEEKFIQKIEGRY